jgi:hypothetical protein
MKRITLIFLFFLSMPFIKAQKHDNNWCNGYAFNSTQANFGNMILNFATKPPSIIKKNLKMNFHDWVASCSDSLGNLNFYSNGIKIFNKESNLMQNGLGLNPGFVANNTANDGYVGMSGVCIPKPGTEKNHYYLFHIATDLNSDTSSTAEPLIFSPFYYTEIDMNANGGLGSVIKKNQILLTGNFTELQFTKHANGRDWWCITAQIKTADYYVYLISPSGILGPVIQHIGPEFSLNGASGYDGMSLDGSFYYRNDPNNGLIMLHFDRCSGLLSNPSFIPISICKGNPILSPDGRFMYLDSGYFVAQLDLTDIDNVVADTVMLHNLQLNDPPIWTGPFGVPQYGPDEKIYIEAWSSRIMHVMHHPNFPGLSCDLEQQGVRLQNWTNSTLNVFPNYRLGKMEGSDCDTLLFNKQIGQVLDMGTTYKTIISKNFIPKKQLSEMQIEEEYNWLNPMWICEQRIKQLGIQIPSKK